MNGDCDLWSCGPWLRSSSCGLASCAGLWHVPRSSSWRRSSRLIPPESRYDRRDSSMRAMNFGSEASETDSESEPTLHSVSSGREFKAIMAWRSVRRKHPTRNRNASLATVLARISHGV